jgi:hypothetical protein
MIKIELVLPLFLSHTIDNTWILTHILSKHTPNPSSLYKHISLAFHLNNRQFFEGLDHFHSIFLPISKPHQKLTLQVFYWLRASQNVFIGNQAASD